MLSWNLLTSKSEIPETLLKSLERSSHTVNLIDNKLLIFGGENEPRIPINDEIIICDLNTNKWSLAEVKSGIKPIARVGHASSVIGNKLFVFGGRTGIDMGENSLNDLHVYDIDAKTWTQLKSNEITENSPPQRSYHAMTALKNKLYIFGGCSADHGRLNDLFEYDIVQNNWKKLSSDDRIAPRGGTSLCSFESINEKEEPSCLYLIAGFKGEELDDMFKYDILTDKWTQIQNLPRKLSVFACAPTKNLMHEGQQIRLILNGGEVDPSTKGHNGAGEFSNDTYVFDGNKWHLLVNFNSVKPSNRGWHSGCFGLDNKFYLFGGNLEDNKRTDELWCLTF